MFVINFHNIMSIMLHISLFKKAGKKNGKHTVCNKAETGGKSH